MPDPMPDPMPGDLAPDPLQHALADVLRATAGPGPAHLSRGTDLRDLGLTSLSMIDLACAAEDRFGVRVPDDDLERFATVGDVVDFLRAAGAQA